MGAGDLKPWQSQVHRIHPLAAPADRYFLRRRPKEPHIRFMHPGDTLKPKCCSALACLPVTKMYAYKCKRQAGEADPLEQLSESPS